MSFFLDRDRRDVWNIMSGQDQKPLFFTLLRWGVRWLEIVTGIFIKKVIFFGFYPFFFKFLRILAKTWFLENYTIGMCNFFFSGPELDLWILVKPWKVVIFTASVHTFFHFLLFLFFFERDFRFSGQNGQKMTKITFFWQFLAIFVIFDILKNDHFWDIFWPPTFGHFEVVQIWLAKLELFPGFLENPKKGSKKWSKKWSFLGPQNVQNDQNIDILMVYPLEKCQGVKKVSHFLFTFFQGSKNSSSPPNDFSEKREIRCLKIVKKREITVLTVLAILGFLKIPYVVNDVFFKNWHFCFVFFCVFWRQKINNFGKIGFWRSKNTFFSQLW